MNPKIEKGKNAVWCIVDRQDTFTLLCISVDSSTWIIDIGKQKQAEAELLSQAINMHM